MSGEDAGTIAGRLPPEPAPADVPLEEGPSIERVQAVIDWYAGPYPSGEERTEEEAIERIREIVAATPSETSEEPPADGDEPGPGNLLEEAFGIIANAYGGDWTTASDEWRAAAERWRDRWHARTPRAETLEDVQETAEKLELLYVPEQHRLHAHPEERCNTDDSSGKRKIREEDLAKVSPDVRLCEWCVSPAEARIIRAGLRRV